MKAKTTFKLLHRILILLMLSFLISSVMQVALAADTDGDGLADEYEVIFLTDQADPDSDDDGVLDGDEGLDITKSKDHEANDPDKDGWNNAMDADSDADGILDGTEKGLTDDDIDPSATDQTKGRFFPDQDPPSAHPSEDPSKFTTNPTKKDTDGDTWTDGEEDRNANGRYEPTQGEKNPNFKDFDDDGLQDDTDDDDDDNDFMPDEFEKLFPDACNPLNPDDANADYDNDGFTNLREYRGNNDKVGDKDWSDPTDPTSKPNIAPVIQFISDDYTIDIHGNKVPRITVEAKQKVTFNESLLKVTDENEERGLKFTWDWDDGEEPFVRYDVRPSKDAPTVHTFDIPSTYTVVLKVEDDIKNEGEAKLVVDVTHPEGASEITIKVPRDKKDLKEKNTIQRGGWIAYLFEDVKRGDKITIDFTVTQDPAVNTELGIRVFVISKDDFEKYKNNDISRDKIPREYEEYWHGDVGTISSKKKIEIEADKDDDIVVILDNRYYTEGVTFISFDEPVEYTLSAHREDSPFLLIVIILVVIIVIVAVIMFSVFWYKTKQASGVTKITREAAIETQRSLDREMAELELEIQDSLRRQSVMAPMTAMPLGQKTAPPPAGSGAQTAASAPGTVPRTPALTGAGRPSPQPGASPAIPGATPGEQPMLPRAADKKPAGAAAPGSTPQPQMLPPAQQTVASPNPATARQPPTQLRPVQQTPAQPPKPNQPQP